MGSVDAKSLPFRGWIVALGAFSALSAIGGGLAYVVDPNGSDFTPLSMLATTPFASFLVPGLILAIVVGGTSLACALLAWRRSHAAIDATLLAGGTLSVWMSAELAMLRGVHWLQIAYGLLGVCILAFGIAAAARAGAPRHRWVIAVTLAETCGYLAPTVAGVLSSRAHASANAATALIVAAGLLEGLACGAGQAWAFPLPVRRLRFALLTAVGAAIVWASVMSAVRLVERDASPIILVLAGGVGLCAIGTAQWFELRRHAPKAGRWILWTALAWAVALPLSFTATPFVDEATSVAANIVLWGCAGMLMAYVMALVTWQGVRRLTRRQVAPPRREERPRARAVELLPPLRTAE